MSNEDFDQSLEQVRTYAHEARDVSNLLANSARSEGYLRNHQSDAEPASDPKSRFLRGKYLYINFHSLATESAIKKDIIQSIVDAPDFVLFVFVLHGIPSGFGLTKLEFHMAGTTSFIFKAHSRLGETYALKLIQAPYQNLEEVRAATGGYKLRYNIRSPYSPAVHESHPTWILMEFVDGLRLSDYLTNLRRSTTFMSDAYFNRIMAVFGMLADALSFFETHHPPIYHGDLTPLNVIIQEEKGIPSSLKLIDFGANYVLQNVKVRHDALVDAFATAETFVAPEVLRLGGGPSIEADLYSLGKIGLDLLGDVPLTRELVGKRLKEMWDHPAATGLAQIIEDLIDDEPNKRSLMLRESEGGKYRALNAIVQEKAVLYHEFEEKSRIAGPGGLHQSFIGLPDVWGSLYDIYRIIRTKDRSYNNIGRGLFIAMTINALCQAAIVTTSILYTLADVKARWLSNFTLPIVDSAIHWISFSPKAYQLGDVWGNLPGRCVALTFGLVAARYYANIFAPLIAPAGFGKYSSWTNIVLRLNSFSYFVPIMLAIAWNPRWWPWCAFGGMLFPTINNLLCVRLAETIGAKAKVFSNERFYETSKFIDTYEEWWVQMATYCLGVGLLGVLLSLGVASDEAIYAYSVCVINMATIYRQNCSLLAPQTQGGLARLFFAGRRWQVFHGRLA